MAVLGAAALLFFGPEQLPRVARKAGNVMREIQNTSQSFIRELERAADLDDAKDAKPYEPPPYDAVPYDAAAFDVTQYEPPAPEPEAPVSDAGEKLAEPRPALDLQHAETGEAPSESAQTPVEPIEAASKAAEAPPETDHAPHL
ncbi:MAG: twin-arginine translocase TatA/TatE family subunit [Candidatus Eremiobacteraeota bacterium]|nr:twin-arginine translocase TatA/TatE family subunit [Candidatus Eremiobacteraeota bacterium]